MASTKVGWMRKKGSRARQWQGSTIRRRWFVSEGFLGEQLLRRMHSTGARMALT